MEEKKKRVPSVQTIKARQAAKALREKFLAEQQLAKKKERLCQADNAVVAAEKRLAEVTAALNDLLSAHTGTDVNSVA